jgi:hypothetical protein
VAFGWRMPRVPVQAQARAGGACIIVTVPVDGNQREVAATMDAARALIAEADAAAGRAAATAQAESTVREWWARRLEGAPRRHISKTEVVRTGIGVEKRWPLIAALGLAMVVPLLLPPRFSLGPRWIVPAVDALLLAAIASVKARTCRTCLLAELQLLFPEFRGHVTGCWAGSPVMVDGGPAVDSAGLVVPSAGR